MSGSSSRELARRLIVAARTERPSDALGRRLLLLEPARTRGAPERAASPARPRRGPWVRAGWCAALAAAVAGLFLGYRLQRAPSVPFISAEGERLVRDRSAAPAAPTERLPTPPQPARPVEPEAAAPREVPAARAPAQNTSRRPQPASEPATQAVPREPVPSRPALSSEIELLTEARAALRSGQGERALSLLDQHAKERVSTALRAEAELLRIEALSALGRQGEASSLATRFVRDNPHSALADRARTFIR